MKQPQILVAGSMNMDLCMYGMDGLPQWGASSFCTNYQYAAGGKGFNQALAAKRQGADVYMAGRVGDDEHGRELLGHLTENGVHCAYVAVDQQEKTGFSTMNMGDEGKYFSIYAPGANRRIQIKDVARALEERDFDMILMQLEMPLEVAYYICQMGAEKGIPIFLDAGPAMKIPLEKLRGAFIISPNEAETAALTGIVPDCLENIEKAARTIYEKACPEHVLLKLGKRGAYLYNRETKGMIPGYEVQAVDTTGAGDTFGAAFCVQYCLGKSIEAAVQIAHAAAAVCVTRKGGQPSIPTREEAEAFFASARRPL